MAIAAAVEAVDQAGLGDSNLIDPERFGIYLGAGEGQTDFPRFVDLIQQSKGDQAVDTARFIRRGVDQLDQLNEAEQEPGMPTGHLASLLNARGPNLTCLTACAASAQAIGEAAEIIRDGDADVMLAGGGP